VSPITVSTVSKADISGDVPTYSKPSTNVNFGSGNNFDTLLGTNEDIELASVELQKQNQLLDAYRTDIQNELNEFNKENAKYQSNVQAELAKHNTDLQVALRQAQVNAADAQQEASQATDVDKFNKAQDQALDLQNKAQTLQAAVQDNDDLVSKFLAELNKYSAQVNTEVQTYSQNLENNQRNYNIYVQQQAKLQADYEKGIQALR
jgi:chromosome segregation ATPase